MRRELLESYCGAARYPIGTGVRYLRGLESHVDDGADTNFLGVGFHPFDGLVSCLTEQSRVGLQFTADTVSKALGDVAADVARSNDGTPGYAEYLLHVLVWHRLRRRD